MRPKWLKILATCLVVGLAQPQGRAQQPSETPTAKLQQNLAERFQRLELLAGRLAELSRTTQPTRSKLLRELIAQSRQRNVSGQFDEVVSRLQQGRYTSAVEGQEQLQAELARLLELLLQEDRDRQIESQRKRVARYVQEVNKLIRRQRGIAARTEGGEEGRQLNDDQQSVEASTGKLSEQIGATEGAAGGSSAANQPQEDANEPSAEEPADQGPNAEQPLGEPRDDDPEREVDSESGAKPQSERPAGEPPVESSPGDAQPPADGKPSSDSGQGAQGGQPGSSGQPGDQSGDPQSSAAPQSEPQTPAERAVEALEQAQKRMQQAQQELEEAERSGALDEQEQALRELEEAKAELEKILRQLREEELERTLVLLEARFRKMLDMQVEVYEETKQLDEASETILVHELEIAGGRLSRKEAQIVREADRALMLLREDGTSVAFPEAVEQARTDMQSIVKRLASVKTGLITQGLEEDVIAALEETLATLQQALAELREQRARQQQGAGEPGEQPLVDRLAELRMIRALQLRVNKRTERYGAMIEGEQAQADELLDALEELAQRERKIFEATKDLHTGRNR